MIQLGYAQHDITPGSPLDLCGFALRQGPSTGVQDPLYIRWIALQDATGQKTLLGSADLISFSRQTYRDLQKQICGHATMRTCNVGLATTHTHSGPVTVRLRYCGKVNKAYLKKTKRDVVTSAGQAVVAPMEIVRLMVGSSSANVCFNRRNPDSGPIDTEVTTVAFVDVKTDKPAAVLVNYACHPVVMGHKSNSVSADYPGALTKYVQDRLGAPCLYLNGACGDINPKNCHSTDPNEAVITGEAIGRAAIEAFKWASPVAADSLSWHRVQLQIPVRVPRSPRDFEERLVMLEERFGISGKLFADRVARDSRLLTNGTYPKSIALELSLLCIGNDVGILFVPGELFSSIGQNIKQMAAPRKILISGFSNGSVGYLPDRQAYADGGYEPSFANFFYDFPEFDPSIEDVLLEGVGRLLKKAAPALAM